MPLLPRWGEEIVKFLACLKQHCKDRGLVEKADERAYPHGAQMHLGGRSPHYWVTQTFTQRLLFIPTCMT